jgi:hypothetical protein
MRALSFIVSALLAGSAYAQDPAAVYTPAGRDLSVPTFVNATVTRVNTRNNTISFRSESGEVSLTVEGAAVSRLGRLRAGDDVLLGYRIDSRSGRPVQVVTAILAGEEMAQRGVMASTSPTAAPVFSTISGRVIRTDAAAGTITVAGGPFNTVGLNGAGVNAGVLDAGVNTADVAAPGTFSTPGSPFSAVIPSLPSVVGQLNVVPPPQSAPALADVLPVGAARDFATRDYDNAVRTLALKANEIDAHWFRYRDGCLRTSALTADVDRGLFATNRDREWFVLFGGDVRTPADDNCRQLMVEMTRMANDWRDLMNRMEETARKNDVLPGAMRESRQRYRVEF